VLSVAHWDRVLGGLLYATSLRLDWARLLQRTFQIDALESVSALLLEAMRLDDEAGARR
jgi:hypothetical protein